MSTEAPTAPPPTQSPAEAAIAQARADMESFFDQANREVYAPAAQARQTAALNPMADALQRATATQLSAAAQQAAGVTTAPASDASRAPSRTPDGRFTSAAPPPNPTGNSSIASQAAAAIPGPPTALASSAQAAPAAAGQQQAAPASSSSLTASTPAPAAPADDFADVPAVDAFDNPSRAIPKGNDWRRIHAKTDHYVKQTRELTAQLEQLRAAAARPPEPPKEVVAQLTTLTQERDQLLTKLEAVAVEKSPRFESMFKPRQDAALTSATQAAGPAHAELVKQLMAMPESTYRDKQIDSLVEELGPNSMAATKLRIAVANADQIAQEKAALSTRSSDIYKQWQSEQVTAAQRQQADRESAVQTTFEQTVREWRDAGAQLDDAGLAIARDVFTGNRTLKDIASAAMWVAVGPKAAAQALALKQQLDAANAELARLRGVQPGSAYDAGSRQVTTDDLPTATGLEGLIQTIIREAPGLR